MKFFCTLFFLFFGMTVQAADLPYAGTWKGSIGNDKVMVCFSSSTDAQYYYLRQLRGINLELDDKAPATSGWKETNGRFGDEEKVISFWTVAGISEGSAGSTLDITWSSPDGKKTIPVKLTKVSAAANGKLDKPGKCDAAFYRPVEDGLFHTAKELKFEGRAYRSVTNQAATAFELPTTVAGSKNFNDYTNAWLKRNAVDFYTCGLSSLGLGGDEWGRVLEPLIWTDSKLVVKDTMPPITCGGGHDYSSLTYETFDLKTGKMIYTWSWIKQGDKSVESRKKAGKLTKLRAMLEKHVEREECRAIIDKLDVVDPHASKLGMVFPTLYFYEMRSCEVDITIPYKQIMPFLTPAGKAAVAEFLQP
ncbi:hypothetical protein [Undibacterium sp. Ji49W]|uniref:hypothetical protein n=1 Tax=Undibacterium sp. Ji49W TaxID=3413040 RepID=UPI003BF43DA6